jgi:3-methyl-2-oxobutanoate hydroxymethyltransferase
LKKWIYSPASVFVITIFVIAMTDTQTQKSPVTLTSLKKIKKAGGKFACLTVYDASFTRILESAGVDVLLVGDSLGNVIQGHDTTLPVSMDDMVYHTANVRRAATHAMIMGDMPFMSYATPQDALKNAGRLLKEGGAHIVKLEGGSPFLQTVTALSEHGIPVCAHLGLLPQSVHKIGGYRVQGKDEQSAKSILDDALSMQAAGADMLLLECVPAGLAGTITQSLDIPVIGIGAGPDCDAQVLVLYDMLGITSGKRPKFTYDFLAETGNIQAAVQAYVEAVKSGRFPTLEQSF